MNYHQIKEYIIQEYLSFKDKIEPKTLKHNITVKLMQMLNEPNKRYQNRLNQVVMIIYHYERKQKLQKGDQ